MKTNEIDAYLGQLPPERRDALGAVRALINAHLDPGFEERLQYGMLSWVVPESRLPRTYNGQPLAALSLGSQKNHLALYMMCVYGDAELRARFEQEYAASGKKLDMGKACLRFKALDALPLEVLARTIGSVTVESMVAAHEAAHGPGDGGARAPAGKKTPTKKKIAPAVGAVPAKKRAPVAAKKPAR